MGFFEDDNGTVLRTRKRIYSETLRILASQEERHLAGICLFVFSFAHLFGWLVGLFVYCAANRIGGIHNLKA